MKLRCHIGIHSNLIKYDLFVVKITFSFKISKFIYDNNMLLNLDIL